MRDTPSVSEAPQPGPRVGDAKKREREGRSEGSQQLHTGCTHQRSQQRKALQREVRKRDRCCMATKTTAAAAAAETQERVEECAGSTSLNSSRSGVWWRAVVVLGAVAAATAAAGAAVTRDTCQDRQSFQPMLSSFSPFFTLFSACLYRKGSTVVLIIIIKMPSHEQKRPSQTLGRTRRMICCSFSAFAMRDKKARQVREREKERRGGEKASVGECTIVSMSQKRKWKRAH